MRKSTHKQKVLEELKKLNEESGRVYCAHCSTPEWDVWHAPGQCPPDPQGMLDRRQL